MNYGIELEFFIRDDKGSIIPAYKLTNNVDGNPVIGELRTKVHDTIEDAVFEIKKLLYLETVALKSKNFNLTLEPKIKVTQDDVRALRKDKSYTNKKVIENLEEFSIYNKGQLGKVLPTGEYKASLQLNISDNLTFYYNTYDTQNGEKVFRNATKSISNAFNYVDIITKLDNAFKTEIKETDRVPGVYAIKDGTLGNRIEYRSLPNNIDLYKLLEVIKH